MLENTTYHDLRDYVKEKYDHSFLAERKYLTSVFYDQPLNFVS